MPRDLAEPWRSFLADLDDLVSHEVRLHCCGGFVVTMLYGLMRTTADLDVLSILPSGDQRPLATVAAQGSALHKTHGVYLDVVTVATCPDSYEDRLTEMYAGTFRHLHLMALDPYDLVLTKLARNADRERYQREMRGYVGVPEREDLTLELRIDIIQEVQQARERRT